MASRKQELTTAEWVKVFGQAAAIGMLHVHLTGGEPLLRTDIVELVAAARANNLYSNLITSGVGLNEQKLSALVNAGLDHIQLSFQDSRAEGASAIAGVNALSKKIDAARLICETTLAFTVNVVVHRKNIDRLEELIAFAQELGPQRIEIANVQYYGWAMENRDLLLPSREQLEQSLETLKRVTSGAKAPHNDTVNAGLKACATQEQEISGSDEEITSAAKAGNDSRGIGTAEAVPCQSEGKITSGAKAPSNGVVNAGLKACATQEREISGSEKEMTSATRERRQDAAETAGETPALEETLAAAHIQFVTPDYYGKFPKPCMGGWGRRLMLIDPAGRAMPCHAAAVIPDIQFENVRERSLKSIWEESAAFQMFRGTEWLQEPCKSCPKQTQDFGGCRCQAFLLTGDASATDPVCSLSPQRSRVDDVLQIINAVKETPPPQTQFSYRTNPQ
jgi:radical SAM protein with 4Fe4S-binding SPASM domain